MKAILLTILAIIAVSLFSCRHTESDYETGQAEFQKEQKALRKSVKKENPAKSVKRDATIHQLTDTEISELTDKVKSAGLWPTDK